MNVAALVARGFCAAGILAFVALIPRISPSVRERYKAISECRFVPPSQVFGIVWSLLFILLWIAAVLQDAVDVLPTVLFFVLLALLVIWQFVFASDTLWAIIVLLITITVAACLVISILQKRTPRATGQAFLVIPLIVWLQFALVLNCLIYNDPDCAKNP